MEKEISKEKNMERGVSEEKEKGNLSEKRRKKKCE